MTRFFTLVLAGLLATCACNMAEAQSSAARHGRLHGPYRAARPRA